MRRRRKHRSKKLKKKRIKRKPKIKRRVGTYCSFCDKRITSIPFECRRCEELLCGEHRLPESHNCKGIKKRSKIEDYVERIKSKSEPIPVETPQSFQLHRSPSRRRPKVHFPRIALKSKLILLFLIIAIVFSFIRIEYSNNIVWGSIYLIEVIVLIIILKRVDRIRTSSTLRLWAINILSGVLILIGAFVMLLGFMISMISVETTFCFLIFGLGLMVIGSYLTFKFRLGSGTIVYLKSI